MKKFFFAFLIALAFFVAGLNRASAYNPYYDDFTRISARPLSMGQSGVALIGDPSAVFYNPACISQSCGISLMHNHSGRHFPSDMYAYANADGKKRMDADHLDGDTQAIIAAIAPWLSLGIGFNFQGEMGYDYRPLGGAERNVFPVERLAMTERFEGIGLTLSPWTRIGTSRRSFFHFYERQGPANISVAYPRTHPADGDIGAGVRWNRVGDGTAIGARQWIAPGLFLGASSSKADFDYEDGASGRFKRSTTGYALHPTGWLTIVWDAETRTTEFKESSGDLSSIVPPLSDKVSGCGWELNLAGLARVRGGSLSKNGTIGAELTLGKLRLLYTEAKNYLPRIIGADPGAMINVHIYGFVLAIP